MNIHTIDIYRELAEIEINLASIRFGFTSQMVDFGAKFVLSYTDGQQYLIEKFDPWSKTGNLNVLWRLIGVGAVQALMTEESFRLVFDDGTDIECKNVGNAPELVLVWGGESPDGGILLDRYPADL